MEKYISSGLKRKDGTVIMCLSYEYYLAHPAEFKYEERKAKESKVDVLKEEPKEYKIENNKIHDKLFKYLFSNKEETVKFINKYLNLRIPLEPSILEVYKTEFVTNLYTTKEADIVYKVKNKNVFFLIEHQSKPDRSMPFRLNEYATFIMRQAVARTVIGRKMPQGEYLLKIMEKHILPLNLRKEANELVERIKKERGENKNMLAVLEMIEKENQSYIMMGRKEGREEGRKEAKQEFALKLLKKKMPIAEIAEITELTVEEIEKIKKFIKM